MAKQYGMRDFGPALVQRIAEIIECHPGMKRTPLSRVVCEALDWRGADGRLCEMACRVTMLRLQADGLIQLPPSQIRQPRRRACFAPTALTDPQPAVTAAVHELAPLHMRIVQGRGDDSRLWNEFMARYHYRKRGLKAPLPCGQVGGTIRSRCHAWMCALNRVDAHDGRQASHEARRHAPPAR